MVMEDILKCNHKGGILVAAVNIMGAEEKLSEVIRRLNQCIANVILDSVHSLRSQ
jgi:hypothetical protein